MHQAYENGTKERRLPPMTIRPVPDLTTERLTTSDLPQYWLYVLFFFSGIPALIYQIVWQRALFIIYGVNVESVTVVVTAFMLGLGLGSLVGGRVSRSRLPLVPVFAAVEFCTSVYGIFSLHLFHGAAQFTAGASTLLTGVCAFALVVTPTILMGATLPILLAYLVRVVPNVGRATGILYFVNTLGSATACFVAGQFTMRLLGMSGSVRLAATINALVGFSALAGWISTRKRSAAAELNLDDASEAASAARVLPFSAGIALAAVSGFIALGYEMVWYRVFSWASGTNPKTFAFLLGSYLAGLALGALGVERRCRSIRAATNHLWFTGIMLVGGNIIAVLVPTIFSIAPRNYAQLIAMVWLACAAAMLGTTFPMVCHLTVRPDSSAGEGLSFLYLSNIVGSAAGSFVAGYILTQILPLPVISALFATAGIVLGFNLMLRSGARSRRYALVAGVCVLAVLMPLSRRIYEDLCSAGGLPGGAPFTRVVENRYGVIAVGSDNRTVIGGGVYDGMFNVDPLHDVNMIKRCYSLFGFLSRPPKHVLMIGLSSGSWAQVLANNPEVESLAIIEINPGYLKLIPEHPEVASILHNPKVNIVIDDGHRWLLRNPEAKFDLIVMNTTYSWRANATNLLSREFLELVRRHLEPGGTHFYNTTGSPEAQFTAVSVFPYAVRIANFVAVSDEPLRFHADHWKEIMKAYRINGAPLLDLSRHDDQSLLAAVVNDSQFASSSPNSPGNHTAYFEFEASVRSHWSGRTVITDDNMAVEWR